MATRDSTVALGRTSQESGAVGRVQIQYRPVLMARLSDMERLGRLATAAQNDKPWRSHRRGESAIRIGLPQSMSCWVLDDTARHGSIDGIGNREDAHFGTPRGRGRVRDTSSR